MSRVPPASAPWRSITVALLCAVIAAPAWSCAGPLQSLAGGLERQVPENAIQGTLSALEDPETRQRVLDVLQSPAVRDATHALVARVTDGTLDALTEDERERRLAQLAGDFVSDVAGAFARTTERTIGPALSRTFGRILRDALATLLSERTGAALAAEAAAVADRVGLAIADAIETRLGPAVAVAIRDDVAPAMSEAMLAEPSQRALSTSTRTITHAAVLGMQDAFDELEAQHAHGERDQSLAGRVSRFLGTSSTTVAWLPIVIVIAAVLVVVALAYAGTRFRRARKESRRREATLLALAAAIKRAEDRPWAGELRDVLRETLRDRDEGDYLRDVLRRNQHLRMRRGGVLVDEDAGAEAGPKADRGHDEGGPGSPIVPPLAPTPAR